MKCDGCHLQADTLLAFLVNRPDRFGAPSVVRILGCRSCWECAGRPDVSIADLEAAYQQQRAAQRRGAA